MCAALRDLLNSCVMVPASGGIRIFEKNTGAKCQFVTIKNCQGMKVVIRLDHFPQFTQYVSPCHDGANKSCDALVVCKYQGRKFFLFVELKSNNPGGWQRQANNSLRFVEYICSLLEMHYGVDTSSYEKVFFLCSTNYTSKKTVSTQKKQDPVEGASEKCFFFPCNAEIYLENLNL